MRTLTIAIDARLLRLRRGIGNYIHALLHEYAQLEFPHRVIAYIDKPETASELPVDPRISVKVITPEFYPFYEQYALPRRVMKDNVDVLHCPANTAPLRIPSSVKLVLTIHDVMYLLPPAVLSESPSLYQRMGRRYRAWIVPRVARMAERIITVSCYSKQDILDRIQADANRVKVIHSGIGEDIRRSAVRVIEGVTRRHAITSPYVFALGASDPRKNTATVIQAFAKFFTTCPLHMLVISGLSSAERRRFAQQALSLGLSARVRLLPFVSREELIALYSGAEMFVYPTIYEGFGFPVLEAMACGTPVITSSVTSMPEVAGEAALFVDPGDVEALAEAMRLLATTPRLRDESIAKGLQRAKMFSWRRAALETLQVYEAAAELK